MDIDNMNKIDLEKALISGNLTPEDKNSILKRLTKIKNEDEQNKVTHIKDIKKELTEINEKLDTILKYLTS